MLSYSFNSGIRSLTKNRSITVISITGLGLGIAIALLIFNYVWTEFSFDSMHSKRDRIYRVESRFYEGDVLTEDWATSSFGYGPAISRELPGVESFVRFGLNFSEQVVAYNGIRFREKGIAYTDPAVFDIFDFSLLKGERNDQLKRPNTVVITEDAAARYFGGDDPMGKVLSFATGTRFVDCEVTGVIKRFPQNSHLNFDFLISYTTLPDWMEEFWYIHEVYTYLLLSPGTKPEDVESAFPRMAEKYKTMEALRNKKWGIHLVPLREIHLNPQKQNEREIKGNRHSLFILMVIAVLILVSGWINYINLVTARSIGRAREISIRKVAGAFRLQLSGQFLMESLLVNCLAALLAGFLVEIFMPLFNRIIGSEISFVLLRQPLFWVLTFAALIVVTLLSGFYPAFIMTRIQPHEMLKGNYFNSRPAGTTRRILVVIQFSAALMLICGTFIVYRQVRYMERQDRGVDINRVIVMNYPVARDSLYSKIGRFAANLRNEDGIKAVTLAGAVPGMEVAFFASNRLMGDGQEQHRLYEMLTVDEYYLETFGFDLVAGRSFGRDWGNESENLVINEAVLPYLGLTDPQEAIGRKILLEGEPVPVNIIGVVKNWHQRSLGNAFTPIMILKNGRLGWVPPRYIAVKMSGEDYDNILSQIEELWNEYFPDASFDYFFLDSFFDNQYKSDRRFRMVVAIFTGLSVFISLLGLWALTAFMASKRMKEMGVRKILGAETVSILFLFTREILVLLLVSLAVAIPVSYLLMQKWLLNYPFHTTIPAWIYFASGLIMASVALLTTGWQCWRVARQNPSESLRYE